jgi:transcriptional regulator with XRE-family HTH domain
MAANAYTCKVARLDGASLSPKTLARMGQERGQISPDLGRRLREARLEAGLTQQELARRMAEIAVSWQKQRTIRSMSAVASSVTRQTISYLEMGQRAPSIRTARLLAAALGLPQRDKLRRDLLQQASSAKAQWRQAQALTYRNRLARWANGLLEAGGRALSQQMGELKDKARREREAGRRRRKGGWPQRHPLVGIKRRRGRGRR